MSSSKRDIKSDEIQNPSIKRLKDSPTFRHMTEGLNFNELSDMTLSSKNTYRQLCKAQAAQSKREKEQVKQQQKLMQKQRAVDPAKNNEPNRNAQ